MADKEDVVDETIDEIEDTTVDTQDKQKGNPKTFTQEEVNKLIQNRIAREKESAKREKQDWETNETTYKDMIEKYEKVLADQITEKIKDIPDAYKKVILKLPILEQLEFIADEKNMVSKKPTPVTPKGDDKVTTSGKSYFNDLY